MPAGPFSAKFALREQGGGLRAGRVPRPASGVEEAARRATRDFGCRGKTAESGLGLGLGFRTAVPQRSMRTCSV